MSRGKTERLGALESIGELAREVGRPKRTMLRQITALHALDKQRGGGGWLLRLGARKLLVNRSALRAAHPELFESKYVSRDEADLLEQRIARLEGAQHDLLRALNATRARLRDLAQSKLAQSNASVSD